MIPENDPESLKSAVQRLWTEPALRGRYPDAFVGGPPLERMGVREGDLERLRTPYDFLGVNLYTRTKVRHDPQAGWGLQAIPTHPVGGDDGPKTDFGWEVWPRALYDMLMRLTRDFDRPVLEVTENGCSYRDGPGPDGVIRDTRRIDYHRGFLEQVARAGSGFSRHCAST